MTVLANAFAFSHFIEGLQGMTRPNCDSNTGSMAAVASALGTSCCS